MDLAQVGGDVSLGQLIIFCYSQALVITDKLPVSLRHSFNRVLVRTANIISGIRTLKSQLYILQPYCAGNLKTPQNSANVIYSVTLLFNKGPNFQTSVPGVRHLN